MNMPTISIIAAVGESNQTIGYKKKLPWNLPADMKRFKQITQGHAVIMGKKTFESLPVRPLPKRTNIVLTSLLSEGVVEGYYEANSLEDALEMCVNEKEVFIIGGSSVYAQSMEMAQKMYITWVHGDFQGDTFFPKIDFSKWKLVSTETHKPNSSNPHPYTFTVYEKVN